MTETQYIDDIIRREGRVYTNRAADRGGPTKFGITQETLRRWRNQPVSAQDVKKLTEREAREIYASEYIRPWAWVDNEELRVLLSDWGVTSSRRAVAVALQSAVGATRDGVIGPETQRLTNSGDATLIHARVLHARISYYTHLALNETAVKRFMKDNPKLQIHNLRGWLNRACEFI